MKQILEFLKKLDRNNNREWFANNKKEYENAKNSFLQIAENILLTVKQIDKTIDVNYASEGIYRIYRDSRFSRDKTPYKTNMGVHFAPGGKKSNKAGYYVHIQPNNSFISGGIYAPEASVLKAIRNDILFDPYQLKNIINSEHFKQIFGELYGEKLKTAPRGFPKDFKEIELLRYKSFTSVRSISEKELMSADFFTILSETFRQQKKLNDYLNQIITNIPTD